MKHPAFGPPAFPVTFLPFRLLPRRCVVSCVLLLGLAADAVAAEPTDIIDRTVAEFFRPFQLDLATLAPDGRHLAMIEQGRDRSPTIVIVNLDDHSTRRHVVASGAEHAVQQLLWVSATRLVFTTRSRGVGSLELDNGEVKALLLSRDVDAYRPEPIIGPRTGGVMVSADMDADPTTSIAGPFNARREISVHEA